MAFTEASSDGVTTGTTPVTIVAAPAASTRRLVKTITVCNRDTVAATITLALVNGANTRFLAVSTLAAGTSFLWETPLILNATNKSITLKTAVAVTTTELDWSSHYADVT